jgi:hypothetical protein
MGEELLPGPDVVGQADGYRWRAGLIAAHARRARLSPPWRGPNAPAASGARTAPASRPHPRRRWSWPGRAFCASGRPAGRGARRSAARHGPCTDRPPALLAPPHRDAQQPVAPAVFGDLVQAHPRRRSQWQPAPPPGAHRDAIDAPEPLPIGVAPVAHRRHACTGGGPRAGPGDHGWGRYDLARPKAPGDDESGGLVLRQAAPAWPHPGRRGVVWSKYCELLWTKDQNASTSTALRRSSSTKAAVWASAWAAAARSQRPSVSYLWPVSSSAALRLPRRLTTSRLRATSAAGVRSRYSGVPRVGPKVFPQPRHCQRCWPLGVRASLATWPPPQSGHGGVSGKGRRAAMSLPHRLSRHIHTKDSHYPVRPGPL